MWLEKVKKIDDITQIDEISIIAIKDLAINKLKIKATDFANPELFEAFDRVE
ncbi:hypothetical protein [Acetivibrio straminisolvens]|jgi:hypothetical protein|uniref:Uncharacterized protein n=1 Tax=Acetivibrio straminisolvens JCM 21531 TaxID=1294263 RepID=W4VB14_9FIRM|nr:hypothetical protein [Acetivibrio straminisolvens]GAE89988.1 hypothetical protein JCM21531_3564 [Acetivibrio straminisolvens JCM 21531]